MISILIDKITIVISRPLILSTLSKFTSGKIICSLIQMYNFQIYQSHFADKPLKSLILGKAILINLSTNSYILFFLKVTFSPAFVSFLVLKFEIDFLNFVTIGFCPVIEAKSSSHLI